MPELGQGDGGVSTMSGPSAPFDGSAPNVKSSAGKSADVLSRDLPVALGLELELISATPGLLSSAPE